jgi:O-antigen ligase
MIALIVFAVFSFDSNGKTRIRSTWYNFESLIKHSRNYLGLCLIFLIVLITAFYSENIDDLFWQLKLKLPFLVLPLAFLALPHLTKKQYYGLYYFLIITITISSFFVIGNYLSNFEEITESIARGKSIPTPIDHIKFSLAVAISIVAGLVLIIDKYTIKYQWERPLLIAIIAFLFVAIHILSVRSGLVTLYISLAVVGIQYIWKAKNKIPFLVAALLLIASPFVAYKFVPSFKSKINYMLWDLRMYSEGTGENYSDSGRIRSIKVGWELAKESPVFGVGFGDVREKCRLKYIENYGHQSQSLFPHNQYLTIFLASGIFGLLLFLFALIQPILYNKAFKEPAFLGLSIIFWVSFLVENTIERSYSIGLFLIFTLTAIHYWRGQSIGSDNKH